MSSRRRRRWRYAVLALPALAFACLVSGALPVQDAAGLADRAIPVLSFVAGITVVAELASAAGVFVGIAAALARFGRGRIGLIWLLVVALCVCCTAFLSLDTTAVLLTPVVVMLARRIGAPAFVFALTAVWLANTASLFLPVSNLTNLLAADRLRLTPTAFAAAFGVPAVAAVVCCLALLVGVNRRALRGRYATAPAAAVADRPLFLSMAVLVAATVPLLVTGIPVGITAGVAAIAMAGVFEWRRPGFVSIRLIPWRVLMIAASLFVIVETLHAHGASQLVVAALGGGESLPDLLRLAGAGAVSANLANNLPAYLLLEPAGDSPVRLAAVLIGVNVGPLVSPWASLATLLWHDRLRAMGENVSWGRFALLGALVVVVAVPVTTLALAVTG